MQNDAFIAGLQNGGNVGKEEMHANGLQSFDSFVDRAVVHEEGH